MHVPAWPVLPDSTLAPQAVLEKFRVAGLAGIRGLGAEICDESGCYDDGTGGTPTPPAGDSSVNLCSLYPDGPACGTPTSSVIPVLSQLPTTRIGNQVGYVMPAQNSAAWATAIAQMANAGMKLAEINMIQPGTVVSANGAILRQATGLPVPVTTSTTNLGLTGSASSGLLVAAVVGLAFVMMMSRGR